MNAIALQSFGYGDQLVRAIEREGLAWFVANDVCSVLEIGNSRQAVSRLEDDERDCVTIDDAMGRERETTIVSESGVYALIFRSRKPAARGFRKWVTSEVLPQIRTTGRFDAFAETANDGERMLPSPTTPDEFELVRLQLQLVREARIAFGTKAARRAWGMAGLPDLSEVEPVFRDDPTLRDRYPSLATWYDERVVKTEGRTPSRIFYNDYVRWCVANDIALSMRSSETAMGRFLTSAGHMGYKSSVTWRHGIALAD